MKIKLTSIIATTAVAFCFGMTSPVFSQDEKKAEKKEETKKEDGKDEGEKEGEAKEIILEPVPNVMKFKTTDLKVKAGEKVKLTFNNKDVLMHNVLILKPGTKDKVGALADAMIADPQGMAKGYVPKSTDILHHTKLLQANQSETIEFTLKEKGTYPFICTFPGHWRIMQGTITAE